MNTTPAHPTSTTSTPASGFGPFPQGAHTPPSRTPARQPSILSPAAEGLGYAGGVLTFMAVVYLLGGIWHSIAGIWQAGLTLVATLSLGGGAVTVGEDDPIARRLSTTLWVLSGVSATLTSYLVASEVAGLDQDAAGFAAGLVLAAGAGALWVRLDSTVMAVVTHVGLVIAAFSGAGFIQGEDLVVRGMVVWLVAAAWVLGGLVDRGLSHPALSSIGSISLIAATQSVAFGDPRGLLLAVPTIVLLGVLAGQGPRTARVWLVLALLAFVPQAADRLPEDLGMPLLMLTAGLVMIGACVVLVQRRRQGAGSDDAA